MSQSNGQWQRYRWLAYGLAVWPYVVVLTADSPDLGTNSLYWLAFPLFLVALMGTNRELTFVFCLNILALLLLPLLRPQTARWLVVQVGSYLAVFTALTWLLRQWLLRDQQQRLALAEANRIAQDSSTQLRLVLEATPVPLSISRVADGLFFFTNAQFRWAFAYTNEALQQLKAPTLFHNPLDRQEMIALFAEEGFVHNREVLAVRSDGSTFWVNVWVEPIQYNGEQMLFTAYQDITERKRVELALRRSTERLLLLQQIEQGIITAQSPDELAGATLRQIQQLIPCQRASLALFDYEAGTALMFAVTTADTATADLGRIVPLSGFRQHDSFMDGRPFIMPNMLAAPDLSELERQRMEEESIRSYVNIPLRFQERTIGSLNLAATQVNPWTEEHINIATELAAQLAIAISQARLRETAERRANELEVLRQVGLEMATNLDPEVLLQLIVSRASDLVDAVAGGLYLTRLGLDGVVCVAVSNDKGMPVGTVYERGIGATGLVWESGEAMLIEDYDSWPGRLPLFEDLHISLLLIPVRWGEKMLGVLSIVGRKPDSLSKSHQDLLELFAAQAAVAIQNAQLLEQVQQTVTQLESQNEELERFAYTVSHDLKSPLVTVKGFLGFLSKDIEQGNVERMRQDITHIEEAADRMQVLLNDLLELSRIGRLVNPLQQVSFNELVEEALRLTAGRIAQNSVTVTVMPEMPQVWGDRPRLVEVLQNLIDNAAKYVGKQQRPQIEIGWENRPFGPVFYVRDNGVGIEAQYHDKVFGLFERLQHDVEGTGIGLALVKRIIEVHNGRVWIESKGLGEGTTFYFTLGSEHASPI